MPIKSYLESLLKLWHPHKGPASVEQVLANGRNFTPAPRPQHIPKRKDRECFFNSSRLALDYPELIYCEGYAIPEVIHMPFHHAWVTDQSGTVIDPTWKNPGVEYFGVPFSHEYLLLAMAGSGYYGIMDNLQWRQFASHTPDQFLFKGEINAYQDR